MFERFDDWKSGPLPGDPAAYYAGPSVTPESVAQIRTQLGLDRSLPVQFLAYVRDLAHGDLGRSVSSGQAVLTDLVSRLPASVELTLCALIFAIAVGQPLVLLAGMRPGSGLDHTCRLIVTLGAALPIFVTALVFVYVFYYKLGVSPNRWAG